MAKVTLGGATRCAVTRPGVPAGAARSSDSTANRTDGGEDGTAADLPEGWGAGSDTQHTLRQAVVDYFAAEFARYGGTPEVIFDRTSDQVLDLSGSQYEFRVRRRGGSPLGLTPLEVDVLSEGKTVQTVPLVVQVTMLRHAVSARRSINQGATVRPADVHLVAMSFTRLDKLGLEDTVMAVGQRAKRFIPGGTLLEPSMLEQVPLVQRGQLVQLVSAAGSVRVVTAAKATDDGLLGEVIRVRALDNKRIEYDATVTGVGQVRIGAQGRRLRLAMGEK
jgi:flagella basal body P-ring formation protein FlgA